MTIMKKSFLAASVLIAGMALAPIASFAQETAPTTSATGGDLPTNIPGHGRVDEVNQRDDNQQNRIDKGEADGKLNAGQAYVLAPSPALRERVGERNRNVAELLHGSRQHRCPSPSHCKSNGFLPLPESGRGKRETRLLI